jgi:hypothetical protein
MPQNLVIQWCLEHLHWPFIVGAAWWLRGKLTEYLGKADETHKQVTNHIPHKLDDQTELLRNMDKNIAVMAAVAAAKKE